MHAPTGARRSIWILSLLFVLSLPAVTTRFYASDEVEYFSWLRSVWFDHDANFENEYQHFYDTTLHDSGFHETFLEDTNEAGRRYNFAPIGCALLWAPFFGAGDLVARVTGAARDGYSHPYIAAVAYGSAIYGFLSVLLTLNLVRRVVGHGLDATLAVWIGTPLIFYMYVAPGFAHACSAFAVSLFLWLWLRVRDHWSPGGAALLAASGALMAMVREQDVFFIAGPALDYARMVLWPTFRGRPATVRAAWGFPKRPRAAMGVVLAAAAAFLVTYAPQLAAYKALNGHFGPTAKVASKMTWTAPHAWGVLFSPEHGLFFWTPLALLALVGLARLALSGAGKVSDDVRWIAWLAVLMFALQIYISGSVESWTVAGSFGQRRFVALSPLLALGLAALAPPGRIPHATFWRTLRAVAFVLGVWWNLGLIAQFGLHTMDRQELTLAANARATFLTLPREAPALAWRYVFARSSFFGLPRQ